MFKKAFSIALAGVIALLPACVPAELEMPTELPESCSGKPGSAQSVELTIIADAASTKTYLESDGESYTAKWHAGDEIGVFFDSWDAGRAAPDAILANSQSAETTATFTGDASIGEGDHTVYAFYPARAFYASESDSIIDLEIPYIQFPTHISYDPRADLLVGVPQPLTVSGTSATVENMRFRRVGSILEVMLADGTSGSVLTSDNIKSVKLEAANTALSGMFRYDYQNGDAASSQMSVSNPYVTADLSADPMAFAGNAVYFIVNPTTVPSGTALTVTVITDRHEVIKQVTLGENIELKSGKVVTLHVGLTDACTISSIYYQDNFDWVFQYWDTVYGNAYGRSQMNLDPIGNQSTNTSATPPYAQPNVWTKYPDSMGSGFTAHGYTDVAKAAGRDDNVLYIQENYLKFGKTNYHTGIQLPPVACGSDPVNAILSFDWSAQDAGKEFVVEVTGGGAWLDSGASVSKPFSQSNTLNWETKAFTLVGLTSTSRISIRPNLTDYAASGKYRFFIDNIRLEETDSQITGNVYGTVKDTNGKPVAGVVVSDGYVVTKTGSDGRYGFMSDKKNPYVFISQPQGYEVPLDGVFPQFWQPLSSDASVFEKHDFTLTPVTNSSCVLLALGDMHLCDRNALYDLRQFRMETQELVSTVQALQSQGKKVYGITLGDMSWDQYWDGSSGLANSNFDLADYRDEINSDFSGCEFPIWQTIGNHDHDYTASGDWNTVVPYKTIIGPTYYSFNVAGYHVISLDNVICTNNGTVSGRGNYGGLTDDILAWLEADLAEVSSSKPVIVAMHEPLYVPSNPTGGYYYYTYSSTFRSVLGSRKIHIVTGHSHTVNNVSVNSSVYEHNGGALCATWWWTGRHSITKEASWGGGTSLANTYHVCPDGSPAGYTIYNLSSGTMDWKYKAFGLDESRQFMTYDRNQMNLSGSKWCPSATDARKTEFEELAAKGDGAYTYVGYPDGSSVPMNLVYINVWDYDPSWTITVTENGSELTVSKLKNAYDPMHMAAYEAVRYQNGNSPTASFGTTQTQHIFRVQASSEDSSLVITVKDRFGNSYTQTMTRPKAFIVNWY